jgi:hypothetical protein
MIGNTAVFYYYFYICLNNAGREAVEPRLTASQGRGRTSPLSGYGTGGKNKYMGVTVTY